MTDVKIVHVLDSPETGQALYSTYDKLPGVVFCFTKIVQQSPGNFDCDVSVLADPKNPVTEDVHVEAEKAIDYVFQETIKEMVKMVDEEKTVK